jgi:hypothetical protein
MGNDSRIDPVGCPILPTIADFAAPYLPSGDLPVHFAKERLVMSIRAQKSVILPDKFVLRIARNFTEFIVDVCDCALNIGNGHDGRDIERVVNESRFGLVYLTEIIRPVRVLNHNHPPITSPPEYDETFNNTLAEFDVLH